MDKTVTLSKETIKAIRDYIEEWAYDTNDGREYGSCEDAEFRQDGCDIMVDFDWYGHITSLCERRDFLPPPNIEWGDEFTFDGYDVTGITAYDDDGEKVVVTNGNEV